MFDKEDKKSVEQLLAEVESYFDKSGSKIKERNKTKLEEFLKRIKQWGEADLSKDCINNVKRSPNTGFSTTNILDVIRRTDDGNKAH